MKIKQTVMSVIWARLPALLLLLVLPAGTALAVDMVAAVDRNPVSINESFKLIIRASESPDDDPDFSPLTSDFEILNQQQSSRSSWVNGRSSKVISWDLDLMAKRVGHLQIPSIHFGDDQTKPIPLQVVENQAQAAVGENEPLYLDVSVSEDEVYVQAQLIYTVRLFQRISLAKASLTEPQVDNAIIEKLAEDAQFNTQVNGVNYTVVERKYAIFPQQSGPLTIAPLTLTAQVASSNRSAYGSIFNSQRTQTQRVFSTAVQLNVLPIPAQFKAKHWLVAEQLHLEQTWSNDALTVTVGEPLTRTITLLAKGLTASQLPEFTQHGGHSSLKVYPDQAVLKNQRNGDGVIAFREQKIAFIPAKPGEYQLEALEIPWFNSQTGQQAVARIPAMTITAVAKEGIIIQPQAGEPATTGAFVELPQVIENPVPVEVDDRWKWLAVVCAAGWLLTLMYLVVKRFKTAAEATIANNDDLPLKTLIKQLQKACKANNAKQAKLLLSQWQQLLLSETNLAGNNVSQQLSDEIQRLNQSLYAKQAIPWQGERLAELVLEHMRQLDEQQKKPEALEPLHRL
ncbi:MAG: BatD family protein [Cycloclasticus sp.]